MEKKVFADYKVGDKAIYQGHATEICEIVAVRETAVGKVFDVEIPECHRKLFGVWPGELYQDHYNLMLRLYGKQKAEKYGRHGWAE